MVMVSERSGAEQSRVLNGYGSSAERKSMTVTVPRRSRVLEDYGS
jgi:hypothetical protein